MSYYPPYKSSSDTIKVKLDLSNYATKDDVKKLDLRNHATKDDVKKVEDKVNENKKEIIFIKGFFYMNIIVI